MLGGFKPVIDSVDPTEVNALTSSLLQILQGQEGTVDSLLTRTSSFTNELAANSEIVESLTDNLERVMTTLSDSGDDFTATVDRLEQLVGQLSAERDPIGAAVEALDAGTASMTDLLTQARPPLAGTVDELARLAPLLDDDKQRLDSALERAPPRTSASWCGWRVRKLHPVLHLRHLGTGDGRDRRDGPAAVDRTGHGKVRSLTCCAIEVPA